MGDGDLWHTLRMSAHLDDQSVDIRPAERRDLSTLVAWNTAMALETEAKVLDLPTVTQGVTAVFDDPRRGFYLVAERDGYGVGGLMVTYEWSDWRDGDFWWIQSVYVIPSARRSGVFRALFHAVEERARRGGAVGLRLYAEHENERAQRTYEGLEMRRCRYHMYEKAPARRNTEND